MEYINKIKKWLDEGKNYKEGVILYSTLPKCNINLLRLFNKNSNLKSKLEYEILKYLPEIKEEKKTVVIDKNNFIQEPEKENKIYYSDLPEILQPVLREAHQSFRDNCLLKNKLNKLKSDEENKALEIQKEITANWKKNEYCWEVINYFFKTKKILQPKKEEIKYTPSGVYRRQQNLYTEISKLQKRIYINEDKLKNTFEKSIKIKIERLIEKQKDSLLNKKEELLKLNQLLQ